MGRVAQALGINSVPALGMFGGGWSAGTALALYWLESVMVIVFVAARIAPHRRWTRKAGHWSGQLTIRRQRESNEQPLARLAATERSRGLAAVGRPTAGSLVPLRKPSVSLPTVAVQS